MSKRKPPAVATIAADRRVLLSVGSMDGAFLAALAKVLPASGSDVPTSTWAPGIGDNHLQVTGGTDGNDQTL